LTLQYVQCKYVFAFSYLPKIHISFLT
jgi:hypothetical protein